LFASIGLFPFSLFYKDHKATGSENRKMTFIPEMKEEKKASNQMGPI